MSDPTSGGSRDVHKRVAAECNNAAWELVEKARLDAGECAQLVTLAATARHHWHLIGTPDNIAHSDLLFAWALARAGAGAAAVHVADVALSHFKATGAAPWERAFAHAAMAAACQSHGDGSGFRQHHAEAEALGAQLSGDDAKYFQAAFRTITDDDA